MKSVFFAWLMIFMARAALHAAEKVQQTPADAGWKLLFNGKDLTGWRTYGKPAPPGAGWKVEDGVLKKLKGVRGGDIITEGKFNDFELSWEWRISPAGNSGVKYLVTEDRSSAPGHEYQLLDDGAHPDGKFGPIRQTAALYQF